MYATAARLDNRVSVANRDSAFTAIRPLVLGYCLPSNADDVFVFFFLSALVQVRRLANVCFIHDRRIASYHVFYGKVYAHFNTYLEGSQFIKEQTLVIVGTP